MGHSELTLETLEKVCECGSRMVTTTVVDSGKRFLGYQCLGRVCRKMVLGGFADATLHTVEKKKSKKYGARA